MSDRHGGSAFPSSRHVEEYSERAQGYVSCWRPEGGMTLRDWFAGQALVGMQAHPANERPAGVASWAYQVADAMLAAREQEPTS